MRKKHMITVGMVDEGMDIGPPVINTMIQNDHIISHLRSAIGDGKNGLIHVPPFIIQVINENRWQKRTLEITGDPAEFTYFEDFVTTPPIKGLGCTVDMLKRICKGNTTARKAITKALTQGKRQGARTDLPKKEQANFVDNVHEVESRPTGNSEDAALRRLDKERPDLLRKVVAKEMTTNAAMIEAGFRDPTITINVKSADSAARSIRARATPEFVRELASLLTQGD